jgi:DNA-binding beta-propeller fold protein YncE
LNVAVLARSRSGLVGWFRGVIAALATCLVASACLAPASLASDSIYWTSYQQAGGLRIGSLGGSIASDLFTGESSPEGVAIDPAAGRIYWADTTSGAIRVANLDGSGARDLYAGENQPAGVAIDPATGKIYWANAVSGTGAIRVGNLDGSGVRDLFSGESYPVGVVIDPAAGKIYWGSYDTFKIRVGNLDGTGARDLFTGEDYPTGLVIDSAAGRLYWTNEFAGTIRVGNLDGTGASNLFTGEGDVGGLAIDPGTGKLYWSDYQHGTIRMGNADGSGTPQSLFTAETNPWFVALLRSPAGTSAPQVSGSGALGTPLSCSQGGWAGDVPGMFFYRAPRTFAYQWYVNGALIAGATGINYTPTAAGSYSCHVIATNQAGSTPQISAPLTVAAAPSVGSSAPAVRGSTTAGFSGSVNPEGLPTTAHFEYGLDARYSASSGIIYDQSTPDIVVGSDFSSHVVSTSVSGLLPNARYHLRLMASNSAGTVDGPDQTFTTASAPAPPAPVVGRTANLVPVSGVVFVKPPPGKTVFGVRSPHAATGVVKGQGFVPLTQARQVPVGSQIDARRGTLAIVLGTSHTGRTQQARLAGPVFSVGQSRSGPEKGLATFTLRENAFAGAPSYSSCSSSTAMVGPVAARVAKLSPKVLQTLKASDNGGKFQTKGRYSSATVRGTIWETQDRCDGTLTVVKRGAVSVHDFGRRRTIIVHAGHSYLAKAPVGK